MSICVYRVVGRVEHIDGSMSAMEAKRMNGESALCYLAQALYRQLDLGFYIVSKILRKPKSTTTVDP
jgi:hypothetical protein